MNPPVLLRTKIPFEHLPLPKSLFLCGYCTAFAGYIERVMRGPGEQKSLPMAAVAVGLNGSSSTAPNQRTCYWAAHAVRQLCVPVS